MKRLAVVTVVVGGMLVGCSGSDKPEQASPAPTTTPAPAPAPAPEPATPAFGGSCTVTVSGTTVCTEFFASAADIEQGCTKSGSASMKTSFSAGHCPTDKLVGKCTMPDHSINFYYAPSPESAMKMACSNGKGTWSQP